MQQEVHLGQQEGQRLGLHPLQGPGLKLGAPLHRIGLARHMGIGFGEEAAGAARGIEHRLAKLGVDPFDHEADDGAGRIELAAVTGGVAHLA